MQIIEVTEALLDNPVFFSTNATNAVHLKVGDEVGGQALYRFKQEFHYKTPKDGETLRIVALRHDLNLESMDFGGYVLRVAVAYGK
jgi:hypothetical protein